MSSATEPSIRPPWIDRRLQALPPRPFRKVHLDFHNTPAVGEVGQGFNAEQFIGTLRAGHIDAAVLFAKDMHGYFYYPTSRGPKHPGLKRDLFGEQIAACRGAGIKTYAYYCVTWDDYLADRHQDWLVLKRDRTTYLPAFGEIPTWPALCLSADDFIEHVLADSRELLERYDVDGVWYDMPLPRGTECFCYRCLEAIRQSGGEPSDKFAQREHKQLLLTEFMQRTRDLAEAIRPGIEIDHNNQTRLGLRQRGPFMSNIDIESLPTGGWGYQYFPVDVRYSRTFGTAVTGVTGRFLGNWADFGGLKHPRQLQVEMAGIVAQAAQCSVGDQPGPSAQLDLAVYETIGAAYERIERLHPFLQGAAPVVEAAIVADGAPLTDVAGTSDSAVSDGVQSVLADSVAGTARLLRDARIQFDIVDVDADFDLYRLLVLPDGLVVEAGLASKFAAFVAGGGAVITQAETVSVAGISRPWADALDVDLLGPSPFSVPFFKPTERIGDRIASYEYALYRGSQRWKPGASAHVLAALGEPAFERGPDHFTSHAHSPMAQLTDYAVAVVAGRVGAISFPIGTVYRETGYWVYRELFQIVADLVLPRRLIRSSSPSAAELSLTQQQVDGRTRWITHIVNTSTDVRWGRHAESYDHDLPLHNVEVTIDVPGGVRSARLAESKEPLELTASSAGSRVVVPVVSVGELVVFEP